MNIFGFLATVAFAAESVLIPLSDAVIKPAVSFADLMKTVSGTGTFSASVVAGQSEEIDTRVTKKSHFTIAFLGDSMIDTLGSDLRVVNDELLRIYPKVAFTLLNYGVGGENIVSGLERVTRDTVYLGSPRPALILTRPDVVIIESFAYNPFSFDTGALEQHWLSLSYIVDALKVNLPETKIVLAATIAPNSRFLAARAQTIKRYLENVIKFAQSQSLPLADAYHPSLDASGEGKLLYINSGDHIHYSDAGRQLFARTVVDAITANTLLE